MPFTLLKTPTILDIFEQYRKSGDYAKCLVYISEDISGADVRNGGEYHEKKENIYEFDKYVDFVDGTNKKYFYNLLSTEFKEGGGWAPIEKVKKLVKKVNKKYTIKAYISITVTNHEENYIDISICVNANNYDDENASEAEYPFHHEYDVKVIAHNPVTNKKIFSAVSKFTDKKTVIVYV